MPIIDFLGGGQQKGDSVSGASYTKLLDDSGNGISVSQRENLASSQQALLVAGKNDSNSVFLRSDRKGNLLSGNYVPELMEQFEGATVNTTKWSQAVSGFAQTQTTIAGLNLTGTTVTTSGSYSILQSLRLFQKYVRVPLQYKCRYRHSIVSNSFADFGFGIPTTTTTIVPNGVCFRLTSSGTVQGVLTYNGSEIAITNILSQVASNGNTIGGSLNMSNSYYTSNYFVYDIIVDDDNAVFTIQDTATGELIGMLSLPVPVSALKMWGATSLPAYSRVVNSGTPVSGPTAAISELQILSLDWNLNLDGSQVAGNLGLSQVKNPYTGAQLSNNTNSTAPASATLSNTAASYTTKDGKWQYAVVAGAEIDYCLFGWQIPTGARFLVEGVRIDTMNTGAAVATSATVLEWAIAINSPAVTLAANTIRLSLGFQSFQIGAAIGASTNMIDINFSTPEVCESGRFIQLILKNPIGTATASQIIRGVYILKGRFI